MRDWGGGEEEEEDVPVTVAQYGALIDGVNGSVRDGRCESWRDGVAVVMATEQEVEEKNEEEQKKKEEGVILGDAKEEDGVPPPAPKPCCPGLGLLLALLSSLIFSVISALVKLVDPVHPLTVAACRCFFQAVFILPALLYTGQPLLGPPGQRVSLVIRAVSGSSAMMLLFFAVRSVPLADATVIAFSSPAFTGLLACCCLRERCRPWEPPLTLLALTGVVLIVRPPFIFGDGDGDDWLSDSSSSSSRRLWGSLAALGTALLSAVTIVVLRRMGSAVSTLVSTWFYSVIGLGLALAALAVVSALDPGAAPVLPPCNPLWLRPALLASGLLGVAAQMLLSRALQLERAGPVALVRTVDVLLSLAWQQLLFGEQDGAVGAWTLAGAGCVVTGTAGTAVANLVSTSRQQKGEKKRMKEKERESVKEKEAIAISSL
ncbi:solute carrier family 35 member G1 [Lethenteron reissneri]|uniref:solute carrier family 35 member G1 n=1 Tax=Lethenteron reissneri TaxID=7753 RepID=UPI002AB72019|nr:solute carrier family 35 member G1 [Lethenteron reissneri]